MYFCLSEDQAILRDSVGRWLADSYDFGVRRRTELADGYSDAIWKSFADLGWLALPFPEAEGGLGGGGVETAVVMEAFGRHLVLEPWLSTVVVGGLLLLEGAVPDRRQDLIDRITSGDLRLAMATVERSGPERLDRVETRGIRDGNGFRLAGRKPLAFDGGCADAFIVSARTAGAPADRQGVSLFLVERDAPGLTVRPYRTHDGRTAAAVSLDNVILGPEALLGPVDGGADLLEIARDHAAAAVNAEAVGSCAYLIEATGTYLKTREQYGKPLAQFQVLQHRLADMYVANELSRSMAYFAALSLGEASKVRMRDVSAAKVQVTRGARLVAQQAVQLHGGMGMSEELDVAHHFKRLTIIARQFGDEAFHLRRFADFSAADESHVV